MRRVPVLLAVMSAAVMATAIPMASAEEFVVEEAVVTFAADNAQETCATDAGWTKVDVAADTGSGPVVYPLLHEGVQRGTLTSNTPTVGQQLLSLQPRWTADVCTKAANSISYEYELGSGSVTTLLLTRSGQGAALSHFAYRLHPPVVASRWCSPGFWRNNPGAWPAGYSTSTVDGRTGVTFGAILASPRTWARTGDFERIADVLSTAAGIGFTGERVADSCPLAADESMR